MKSPGHYFFKLPNINVMMVKDWSPAKRYKENSHYKFITVNELAKEHVLNLLNDPAQSFPSSQVCNV